MDYQTFTYFHVVLENEKPSEEEEKEARMQRKGPPYSVKLRGNVADYL